MDQLPEVVPERSHAWRYDLAAAIFRRWPWSQLQTNPAYRWPIIGISVVLGLLTLFQLALIAGVPWGRAAWGGQYTVLPLHLRLSSALSIAVYGLTLKIALDRASESYRRVYRRVTVFFVWLFTVYFFLGVIMNLKSSSPWEKYLMAPVAFVLGLGYARLVRRPRMTDRMVHVNS